MASVTEHQVQVGARARRLAEQARLARARPPKPQDRAGGLKEIEGKRQGQGVRWSKTSRGTSRSPARRARARTAPIALHPRNGAMAQWGPLGMNAYCVGLHWGRPLPWSR